MICYDVLLLSFLHSTFFFCKHNIFIYYLYYYSVVLDYNKAFEIFQEQRYINEKRVWLYNYFIIVTFTTLFKYYNIVKGLYSRHYCPQKTKGQQKIV